jgi:hypothetical protein
MIKIYQQDEKIRQSVLAGVRKLEIPDEVIDSYFSQHIVNGSLAVHLLMPGMIPEDKQEQFIELTDTMMLHQLKKYAGIEL